MKFFSIYYPASRDPALPPSKWEDDCVWVGHPDPKPAPIPTDLSRFMDIVHGATTVPKKRKLRLIDGDLGEK